MKFFILRSIISIPPVALCAVAHIWAANSSGLVEVGMRMWGTAQRRVMRVFSIGIAESCSERVPTRPKEENKMSIGTILLIILVLALLGVIPTWPHSRGWGYGPSGGVGLILVIVLILFLLGKI
jgi:hypothetical protein